MREQSPEGTVVVLLNEATGGAELREASRKMKAADI